MADPKRTMVSPRVRASERAIKIAIKAMQDSGLLVSKLVVVGATVEIHAGGPADTINAPSPEASRLKDW